MRHWRTCPSVFLTYIPLTKRFTGADVLHPPSGPHNTLRATLRHHLRNPKEAWVQQDTQEYLKQIQDSFVNVSAQFSIPVEALYYTCRILFTPCQCNTRMNTDFSAVSTLTYFKPTKQTELRQSCHRCRSCNRCAELNKVLVGNNQDQG
jgi:hypothetical protein